MPVSATDISIVAAPSAAPRHRAAIATCPEPVNLIALLIRLSTTWRSRASSPTSAAGIWSSTMARTSSPFLSACPSKMLTTSSTSAGSEKACASSSTLPASSLERSRMSLSRRSRLLLESWIEMARCSDSLSSFEFASTADNPITAFIGVRISWLIIARNSDFARLAAVAACSCPRSRSARPCRSRCARVSIILCQSSSVTRRMPQTIRPAASAEKRRCSEIRCRWPSVTRSAPYRLPADASCIICRSSGEMSRSSFAAFPGLEIFSTSGSAASITRFNSSTIARSFGLLSRNSATSPWLINFARLTRTS